MVILNKSFVRQNLAQIALLLLLVLIAAFYLLNNASESKNSETAHPGFNILRPPGEVYSMALQGDYIWAGGVDGLYKIDISTRKVVVSPYENPSMKFVRAILVDSAGVLWVGYDNGISTYDGKTWSTMTKDEGLPDNRVNSLMQDGKGRIWVGTWSGAVVFDNGTKQRIYTTKDGLLDNTVNAMLEDDRGGIWFGSYNTQNSGISYLSGTGEWSSFTTENGLPHNSVTSLYKDGNGDIWAGTGFFDTGGAVVFGFQDNRWIIKRQLAKKDGLAGEKVRSIFQDKNGHMWLGSEYGGIAILQNGKQTILTTEDGLSDNEVKSILQDKQCSIWLGTKNGITIIDANADCLTAIN
jgi:ligand-binding sensor domain-containing protein